MTLQVVILAAGQSKRMQSDVPKVLHPLAGRPLLDHVLEKAVKISKHPPIVVYGYQGNLLKNHFSTADIQWVEQKDQLGTAHALMQAMPAVVSKQLLVLYADVPLISDLTLKFLLDKTQLDAVGLVTAHLDDPSGYGRIKRNQADEVIAIIEEKDALLEERAIREINSGIYVFPTAFLRETLPQLANHNQQNEFYLTDVFNFAAKKKLAVQTIQPYVREEIYGVNDRVQLARLERIYMRRKAETFMQAGVSICDPERIEFRGEVSIGRDVSIDINVILAGKVQIGNHCVIGPNVELRDVIVGDHVEVKANSLLEACEIGTHAIIGPFARIRPGTKLADHVHVGNFVEIKNSQVGAQTKINHLSYIGDSLVGRAVNIGAGTITCNYDGANKHQTIIEDDVFIGSDTQLVAPVIIGKGATIGAGSTITKEAPPHALTLTQNLKQRSNTNWKRPKKDI